MYKTIQIESTSSLPLTRENLLNFQNSMSQQKDSVANEILQRYCHELLLSKQPSSYRERCHSTPPQRDEVVASPRALPFPYHNDSMFLPTAEQIQYQHLHTSVVSSSTSRADSSSTPPESEYLISRPHSTTNIQCSNHSLTSLQQPSERRSLPSKFDISRNLIISKSNKKQRFLHRFSSFDSNSSTLSEPPQKDDEKKPLLKRILKIFSKSKKIKEPSMNDESIHQVWYCQYSKNPSARFEKYYHHQRQMVPVS